jgi:outer membrane receptor protein involved in Fe transport
MHSFSRSLSFLVLLTSNFGILHAEDVPPIPDPPDTTATDAPVTLDNFTVTEKLNRAREDIVPSLGASSYELDAKQILAQAQGADASFSDVLLRVPGVAQDAGGQIHLRGEHANLQYRINDVLLPEGISGFGQELDTRFVDSMQVLTGSLPAQYGYRTSGVVDIHTKTGERARVESLSLYGGAHNTVRPSVEFGGNAGGLDYYVNGSYDQNDRGIENPTSSRDAVHDHTRQLKGFGYFSFVIDPNTRLNLIVSGSHSNFQIPNNPDQEPGFALQGAPSFDSTQLNENQRESNGYAVLAFQKTFSSASVQAVAFTRSSRLHFTPDPIGDLIFNGVASDVNREILSHGLEIDSRWALSDAHTLRSGILVTADRAATTTSTSVFAADAAGQQLSNQPITVDDHQRKHGLMYGVYMQDEWKVADRWTLNYGGRADAVDAYAKEGQLSPRANLVFAATEMTTFHFGYARYFTPPPLELLQTADLALFAGTTNAPKITSSSAVRSERSHYFDVGVSHKFSSTFSVNLDSYYKRARDQLDEGQFGQALIFAPFNYDRAQVYGAELSGNYTRGKFSAYANFAVSRATGRRIVSGEFQFDPDELDYIAAHDVRLDHDQTYTASAGASYQWRKYTSVYADALFGSGLRRGFANTEKLPSYQPVNVGIEHTIPLADHRALRLRLDVVNVFDEIYAIRDGSGIGVGAPQFAERRSVYGGATLSF